jgi:hypothetical protein
VGKKFSKKIVLFQSFFLLTPPMEMEKAECSETPAHKIQTPGESPKRKNTTLTTKAKILNEEIAFCYKGLQSNSARSIRTNFIIVKTLYYKAVSFIRRWNSVDGS